MSLVNRRQSFLPSSMDRCLESDDMWGDIQKPLFTDCKNKGFDFTGKYFTMYFSPSDGYIDRRKGNPEIYIFSVDQESQILQVSLIRFPVSREAENYFNNRTLHGSIYDPTFVRFTTIQKFSSSCIRIQSGCIKNELDHCIAGKITSTSMIKINDSDIELFYPGLEKVVYLKIQSTKSHGRFLIIGVQTEEFSFVFDLIRFNETKMWNFKRVSLENSDFNPEKYFAVSLDLISDMFYIYDGSRQFLYGYDFLGNKCLEVSIFSEDELNKSTDLPSRLDQRVHTKRTIKHLHDSVFVLVQEKERAINEKGYYKIVKIDIENGGFIELQTVPYPDEQIVLFPSQCFDQIWSPGWQDVISDEGQITFGKILFYSFESRRLCHLYDCLTTFQLIEFNWALQEMALVFSYQSKTWIEFVKLPNVLGNSLKHFSRLACLKTFHEDYLKEKLPKCLQRFCGII
uniref:Uncharacterized protein n=1 Tax=Clytia hemisphaerica TaxID=252671 RepID=A0A7M5UUU7_9CNID